jgi:hypothetical protein
LIRSKAKRISYRLYRLRLSVLGTDIEVFFDKFLHLSLITFNFFVNINFLFFLNSIINIIKRHFFRKSFLLLNNLYLINLGLFLNGLESKLQSNQREEFHELFVSLTPSDKSLRIYQLILLVMFWQKIENFFKTDFFKIHLNNFQNRLKARWHQKLNLDQSKLFLLIKIKNSEQERYLVWVRSIRSQNQSWKDLKTIY